MVRLSGGEGSQFLSLREAYIPNLCLLRSLEPFKKFVVVGGGWVVVSKPILVISLKPKSRLINITSGVLIFVFQDDLSDLSDEDKPLQSAAELLCQQFGVGGGDWGEEEYYY